MIILRPYEQRLLMPVPQSQWRDPSQSVERDQFGNLGIQTRFRITARLHDGHPVWRGWLDDRDEADSLFHDLLRHQLCGDNAPRLSGFPEMWGDPELLPHLGFELATVVFLTSSAGSNQTYTSPLDWNNASNTIECVGPGGGGAAAGRTSGTVRRAGGGGGGAYSKIVNFAFATPGTTTATRRVGAAGVGGTMSMSGGNQGSLVAATDGADTWFDGTSAANAACSALGGDGGTESGAASSTQGGPGGTTGGVGSTKRSGGRGGNITGQRPGATGGGGAAAAAANGSNGVDNSSSSSTPAVATAGGDSGDGANGGSGSTSGSSNPGGDGAGWDASHGSGAGGGGSSQSSNNNNADGGVGGDYGGGGGGAAVFVNNGTATGGDGRQGLIVITYDPVVAPKGVSLNMPNMGL